MTIPTYYYDTISISIHGIKIIQIMNPQLKEAGLLKDFFFFFFSKFSYWKIFKKWTNVA